MALTVIIIIRRRRRRKVPETKNEEKEMGRQVEETSSRFQPFQSDRSSSSTRPLSDVNPCNKALK